MSHDALSATPALDPAGDLVALTRALVDIPSVSGNEQAIADAVEQALRHAAPHLAVIRDGDTVIARTELGRAQRVILAGHLDTVPIAENLPSSVRTRTVDGTLHEEIVGRGTCDMKGGDAVFLALAAEAGASQAALENLPVDLTWIFYDHEEVDAADNSLTRIAAEHPEYLHADFAILGEPTNAGVEAGCKGTMKLRVTARGIAAHSARDWVGDNAIHHLAPALQRLADYQARRAIIDDLEYREALNAVMIDGGVAGNVIPDRASMLLNYRFAPDITPPQAAAHVREVLSGLDLDIEVIDQAAGALPGLDTAAARSFLAALGDVPVAAKQGWTDVARFSALGTPAVNFGPGDPLVAHTDDEHIPVADLHTAHAALRRWLGMGTLQA